MNMRSVFVSTVLVVGMLAAPTAPAAAAPKDQETTYLFVINSEGGTTAAITAKSKGVLRLTLRGVSDHATQFADRPIRKAYVLSTRDLVRRWDRLFAESSPNAVLTFSQVADTMPHSIVVTLSNPRYRPKARTLTFRARQIHRKADLSPDARQRVALPHRKAPATFVSGSLFIDSVQYYDVVNGCMIVRFQVIHCDERDLSEHDFTGLDLSEGLFRWANFRNSILTRVNLYRADMSSADFRGAVAIDANMSHASLIGARLNGADLRGANLTSTSMYRADFFGANLSRANLSGVSLADTNLTGANLSGATWPDGRICGQDAGTPAEGGGVVYSGQCLP